MGGAHLRYNSALPPLSHYRSLPPSLPKKHLSSLRYKVPTATYIRTKNPEEAKEYIRKTGEGGRQDWHTRQDRQNESQTETGDRERDLNP